MRLVFPGVKILAFGAYHGASHALPSFGVLVQDNLATHNCYMLHIA